MTLLLVCICIFIHTCTCITINYSFVLHSLREKLKLKEPYEDLCLPLIDDVIHPEKTVRKAAAKALERTISCHPEFITTTIQQLKEKYEEKLFVRMMVLINNTIIKTVPIFICSLLINVDIIGSPCRK